MGLQRRTMGATGAGAGAPVVSEPGEYEDGGMVGFQDLRESGEVVSAGRVIVPRSVDVECVMHGALVRLSFGAGAWTDEVLDAIRQRDPAVKFKTEFPAKGGFGPRETKLALVLVMNARVSDSGKFVELTCTGGGEDFTVSVGRNSVESFVADLKALGKVSEKNLGKVEKAFAEKSTATVVLSEAEQFGVKYWEKDGRRFAEGYQAEGPKEEAKS